MQLWKKEADVSSATIKWLRFKIAKKVGKFILLQQELADLIGISRGAISNYEKKRRFPTASVRNAIISLCRRFNIKLRMANFTLKYRDKEPFRTFIDNMYKNYYRKLAKKMSCSGSTLY